MSRRISSPAGLVRRTSAWIHETCPCSLGLFGCALAPVQKDQGWEAAQPKDIAQVHALAEAWRDHDPTALAAAERIRTEVRSRYGIDTHDVETDAAYLESGIETISAEQARRPAVAEHQKGMALIAAAQAEGLCPLR